jgi:hypothetical protein
MRHRAISGNHATAYRRTKIGRCAAVEDHRRLGWLLAGRRGQLNGALRRITMPHRRNHDTGHVGPLR